VKQILWASLAASSLLMGAETIENTFVTHSELGYINTQGNTDTESFALTFNAKGNIEKHVLRFDANAQYSKDEGTETKNKWTTEFNYDYEITKRIAFNYLIGMKQDKFSTYDWQFYTGPGALWHALKQETQALDFQANILYSEDNVREDSASIPPIEGEIDRYAAWRAGLDYKWKIYDNLKFIQLATFRSEFNDFENYFITSKTAFESKINGNLSMGASYLVDYTNNKSPDKEYADRTFMVSLIIDY
jgi:putative salt-induced outer membrane protein